MVCFNADLLARDLWKCVRAPKQGDDGVTLVPFAVWIDESRLLLPLLRISLSAGNAEILLLSAAFVL
jgi:hypothetical protein